MTLMCIGRMNKKNILEELQYLQTFVTPIVPLDNDDNEIYVKKEEYIPFSFGGNKVRIAAKYFMDLIENDCDSVITYGASSSNMCRVIANLACKYHIDCTIISPEEEYVDTANSILVKSLGAKIITTPIDCVHQTIEGTITQHKNEGKKPYFIYGGGHGKLGTDSYRNVMNQIHDYEIQTGHFFDYIFITVGTGTSISGLILQNKYGNFNKKIIGISIAREISRANKILEEAVHTFGDDGLQLNYELFDYRLGGYGKYTEAVENTIKTIYNKNGLNLDLIYTGKAFTGMQEFIKARGITHQKLLFIHTGGTPLFFDALIKLYTPSHNYMM